MKPRLIKRTIVSWPIHRGLVAALRAYCTQSPFKNTLLHVAVAIMCSHAAAQTDARPSDLHDAPHTRPTTSRAFLNLDFEAATPYGEPLSWYVDGASSAVRVSVASDRVKSGRTALHVIADTEMPVAIYTPLFLDRVCTHEVVLRGLVYLQGGATLRPILFAPNARRAIGQPVLEASSGWQPFEHRMSSSEGHCLPTDTKIGVLVFGPGETWVDALSVQADGATVHSSAIPRLATNAEIALLKREAVRVPDQSSHVASSSRTRVRNLFGSARVVGLGENSHGAAALFRVKLELIKFLIAEHGCRVLALEAPASEMDKVNDYVLNRSSDRDAALAALMFPSWQTEEMWRVVEWLREHNRSSGARIQLRGFDVQHPRLALEHVRALMTGAQRTAAADVLAALDRAIAADFTAEALAQLDKLNELLHEDDSGRAEVQQQLRRHARILRKGILVDNLQLGGKSRDAYMAEEVSALLHELRGQQRLVIWADNTHVSKAGRAMGAYLSGQFRDAYLSIGLTFNRGHYFAYGPELRYPAQQGFPGTHEHTLSLIAETEYLVKLASLPSSHPIRQTAGFRYIGSRPQRLTQFHPHLLEEHFDVVGFVDATDSTRLLVTHTLD